MNVFRNTFRLKKTILGSAILSFLVVGSASAQEPGATDPLFRYQWHLLNTGQKVIADSLPVAGVDINVDKLHRDNIRGKGILVAVVDDGLEINHEDLSANVRPGSSKNFYDNSTDPTPQNGNDYHGTAVGGIIAAVGWNNKGVRGVAPEAQIGGFNFLSQDGDTRYKNQNSNIFYAWGDGIESRNTHIFNNSWGGDYRFYPAVSVAETTSWERLTNATRNGKGGIYVKSAGNSFDSFFTMTIYGIDDICRQVTKDTRVSCASANADPFNNYINVITVGAVNAQGVRSSYSSAGPAIWVAGFGGEYGNQSKYASLNGVNSGGPAIVTTDLSGCSVGGNSDRQNGRIYNDLDTSNSKIDASCNYLANMNGTSAAAPTVSGVAALILQANPALTARDVKYILATTARKVDPNYAPITYQGNIIEEAWITNKAGHPFSNWYGFGLVNAEAAVAKAKTFTSLSAIKDSGWLSSKDSAQPIRSSANPAALKVNVDSDAKVENVQVSFNTSHNMPRNLRVTLTSPSGTESTLMTPLSTLQPVSSGTGFTVPLTSSNAFLDEQAGGIWTLKVSEINGNSTELLKNFKIRVVGH